MNVIHWSPASNHEAILEKGLLIKDTRIACTILTPFHELNRWWLDFQMNDTKYLGYIFELVESDFPLKYGHWLGDTDQVYDEQGELRASRRKTIADFLQEEATHPNVYPSLQELKEGYKNALLWRIGEHLDVENKEETTSYISNALRYFQSPKHSIDTFIEDWDFMRFTFEDYQLLLFQPISPNRLIKIVQPDEVHRYTALVDDIRAFLE